MQGGEEQEGEQEGGVEQANEQAGGSRAGRGHGSRQVNERKIKN